MKVNIILGTRDRTGPGREWKKKNLNYELGRYDLFSFQLKKLVSKVDVIELSGLGHMPQFEDYKKFKEIFFPLFN